MLCPASYRTRIECTAWVSIVTTTARHPPSAVRTPRRATPGWSAFLAVAPFNLPVLMFILTDAAPGTFFLSWAHHVRRPEPSDAPGFLSRTNGSGPWGSRMMCPAFYRTGIECCAWIFDCADNRAAPTAPASLPARTPSSRSLRGPHLAAGERGVVRVPGRRSSSPPRRHAACSPTAGRHNDRVRP